MAAKKETPDIKAARLQRENIELHDQIDILNMRIISLEKRIERFYTKEAPDERKKGQAVTKKGS